MSEMTGGYSLLLPITVGLHALLYSLRQAIDLFLAGGEPFAFASPPRHICSASVGGSAGDQFLSPEQIVTVLRPVDSLATVIERLSEAPYPILPVVDEGNRLLGVVDVEEVHLASQAPSLTPLVPAADLMRTDVQPLTPEDTLDRAQELFVENDLLTLPIVNDLQRRQVIGMVRRFDIASAYLQRLHGPAGS